MWSDHAPLVHVLNGDYPAADVRRMSLPGLRQLVARLVQCTAESLGTKSAARPKWWPNGVVYNRAINLGLDSEREVKFMFKQLIVRCCDFFKSHSGDENRPTKKRKRKSEPWNETVDGESEFLQYFRLKNANSVKRAKLCPQVEGVSLTGAFKLGTAPEIPISSNLGKAMLARDKNNYCMTEELKLKRLERSEWYTNKGDVKDERVRYPISACNKISHYHVYKMPKRQYHQRRPTMHNAEVLGRFCKPLLVNLTPFDAKKKPVPAQRKQLLFDHLNAIQVNKEPVPGKGEQSLYVKLVPLDVTKILNPPKRELVVLMRDSERRGCDLKMRKCRNRQI